MTVQMDDSFRYFYDANRFGPAEAIEPVPLSTIDLYRGRLPNQMLEYWKQFGFCSFGKGLLWTVDPSTYAPLLESWLSGIQVAPKDDLFVIGRSAFGELYVWGTRSGQSLKIYTARGMLFPRDQTAKIAAGKADFLAQRFFGGMEKKSLDQQDEEGRLLFDRALKSLGQLQTDEMYGFEPALSLGGRAKLENLRKVKIVPHLTILAQFGERKVMRDIVQDARAAGLIK